MRVVHRCALAGQNLTYLAGDAVGVPVKDGLQIAPLRRRRVRRQLAHQLLAPPVVDARVTRGQRCRPEHHEPGHHGHAAYAAVLNDAENRERYPRQKRFPPGPDDDDRDQRADTKAPPDAPGKS